MTAKLSLSTQNQQVSYDELSAIPVPEATRTYRPIGHHILANMVKTVALNMLHGYELYKEQYGIEKNFGFLKDPLIVNSIFLKKNERIEVLGMVLLIALLIWRLMERTMRQYIAEKDRTITGWDNRQTHRPTAFMMTTKFTNTLVLTVGRTRKLARSLRDEQKEFLAALKVSVDIFTVP